MNYVVASIMFALGCALTGLAAWFWFRARAEIAIQRVHGAAEAERLRLEERVAGKEAQVLELKQRAREYFDAARAAHETASKYKTAALQIKTKLDEEQKRVQEQFKLISQAREQLSDAFRALASKALASNNEAFLQLATIALEKNQDKASSELEKREHAVAALVQPIRESLRKVDDKIQALESAREGAYRGLSEQVRSLQESQADLRRETANLVRALRTPAVRGRWGELQLRRVVELAGMLNHCDFREQTTLETEEGRLRPDVVVQLAGKRQIVIDAKVSLEAYLNALDAQDDDAKNELLHRHAQNLRSHVTALGKKSYFEAVGATPEFVVLFVPGEVFFSAALEKDPALIDYGVDLNVIVASPTTLIALLRAVAYGWREERLAENAREISELGRELFKRLGTLGSHFSKVGTNLRQATEAYNQAVGSLESRVLVSARRFADLHVGVTVDALPMPPRVDQSPRAVQAEELLGEGEDRVTGM